MLYVDLSRKLADLGYIIDRYTFDCGERVTVRERGSHKILVSASAECGEERSASQEVEAYMDKLGWPRADSKL